MGTEALQQTREVELFNARRSTEELQNHARVQEGGEVLAAVLNRESLAEDMRRLGQLYRIFVEYARDASLPAMDMVQELMQHRENLFPQLVLEMEQIDPARINGSHQHRDPLRHTIEAMYHFLQNSRNSGRYGDKPMTEGQVVAGLCAITFHDLGKIIGPRRDDHATTSVVLAERWINILSQYIEVDYGVQESGRVERQIRMLVEFHDAIGHIASKRTSMERVVASLEQHDPKGKEYELIWNVQLADMLATPGMKREFFKENVETYFRLCQRMVNQLEEEVVQERLPKIIHSMIGQFSRMLQTPKETITAVYEEIEEKHRAAKEKVLAFLDTMATYVGVVPMLRAYFPQ